MSDYIESETLANGTFQYQNSDAYHAVGADVEVNGRIGERLEGGASFSAQHVRDVTDGDLVPNSPHRIGKLRLGTPLIGRRVWLTASGSWLSSRNTSGGVLLPGVPLLGVTLATQRLTANWDLQFGVRNLFDRRYFDPAAGPAILDRVLANGRSCYLKLIWRSRE